VTASFAPVGLPPSTADGRLSRFNAQHELAFRKRRVGDKDGNPEVHPVVRSCRNEIRRLGKTV
jgi:hypothetical protein